MSKARTAAAKRKQKRGRPAMTGVPREPNGRVSRSGIDHEPANVVALDARRRHLGITMEQAKDQKAGTFIGYLSILGRVDGLSREQYEAAQNYINLRQAYLRAIGAPGRVIDMEGNAVPSSEVTEAYEDWVANTKESYANCRDAIQNAQNENRSCNLWAALDLVLERDERLFHMIGDTRILCNALCKFFRVN
jgi:hypothetical protein